MKFITYLEWHFPWKCIKGKKYDTCVTIHYPVDVKCEFVELWNYLKNENKIMY